MSLQVGWIKRRSAWSGVRPNPKDGCPHRRKDISRWPLRTESGEGHSHQPRTSELPAVGISLGHLVLGSWPAG